MCRSITRFTPGRIGTALLLLMACSIPAWAQLSKRVEGRDATIADTPIRQRVKINDSTVRMYGTLDAGSNSSQVFKILTDGTYTPLGPVLVGNDLEGMDINPLTGDLYAITASGTFAGDLWKVDKTTGAVTLIGNTGLTELISASFHPITGEFWVYKHLGGLYTIDLTTAAATFQFTPIGTGVFKTWEGLAWDTTGTYLYGQNRNLLYRWNPVTHVTQILCNNLVSGEGLDFAPDGTLYGGQDLNDPPATRIFILDPTTCSQTPSGFTLPMGDIESIAFEKPKPPCTGAIGDFVWDDKNGNGIQDAGEPGIPNVTVTLKTTSDATISSTTTNASGLYTFPGLCEGDYKVVVDETTLPPVGYIPAPCNVGSDDTVDNDCSGVIVHLPSDASDDQTIDFGYNCGCIDTNPCTDDSCEQFGGCLHNPANCDDLDPCTVDSCNPATGCVHTALNVDDGNLCTIDSCDSATGVHHDPVSCDDGNACSTDDCNPASGCSHRGIDCDDHNKCTNDSCDPTTGCVNAPVNCDNGNACNLDACDPASGCTHTVIDCDDHDKCTNDSCDPSSGCVNTPIVCDDGSACTTDTCESDSGCTHTVIDCNDSNACTNDSCNPVSGCVNVPVKCDDGNACTTDACDPASGCTHSLPGCDDQDPCTTDTCDTTTGCAHTPVAVDDSNACTADTCDATGVHHTPISCDDANACTTDSCDPATGCANSAVDANDSNACTADTCDPATGVHNTPISCDDSNACTTDSCDPATGCANSPVDANDSNACTADTCDPATGVHNTPISCDDSNACTTDSCDPATGCQHATPGCDDSNPCTVDSCSPATGCEHTPVDANDNNACTADSCDETGVHNTPISCDDANACTTDSCDPAKGCQHATPGCDDSNPCTVDSCSPASGCEHSPVDVNDNNACTADSCDATGVHHTPVSCDDGNPCTADSCSPATGCVNAPVDVNDNNACTADSCDATGVHHAAVGCDDQNACTVDACDPSTGCVHTPAAVDDSNACTTDSCDTTTGVKHTPVTCNDGDKCTDDSCDPASGCVYSPVVCNDNDSCTSETCNPATGCISTPITPAPAGCGACTGKIGDFIWNDLDRDGIQDPGEPGLAHIKVTLRDGCVTVGSTYTDSNGYYEFNGLCGGQYKVDVYDCSIPRGYEPSPSNVGSDRSIDSNPSPASVILTNDHAINMTIDFGFHAPYHGSQGCSNSYWKNHEQSWGSTGYSPNQSVVSVFSSCSRYSSGNSSLHSALRFTGGTNLDGAVRNLLKIAVSSLLNSTHPSVAFPRSRSQVISQVNSALSSGNRNTINALASGLDRDNNQGCPCN